MMQLPLSRLASLLLAAALSITVAGCASEAQQERDFFTSGSREADQRAAQRMVKEEQLSSGGEEHGGGEEKRTLYERLGGEEGVQTIVSDFVARAMADPRVNWERKGVVKGGWFRRNKPVEWQHDAQDVANLKKHMAQFIALATGGPVKYEGGEMRQVHAGLRITNAEFDASIGDLKATLDKLGVPTDEQKELLAVVESTRPQVVTER
jgi:hemoglobin